ncbi:murein transglycosylase A [Pseudorhizobium marinum]|uniref:murein transglycosylase A n=1 Tax=Pseudorhizobium marinum TaxID=1496690 RepID=UPI0004955D60|nr:murein transglycosylase A [Pseudorhizobium marinum]
MTGEASGFSLRRTGFGQLPGWAEDDPSTLFQGMLACLGQVRSVKPYRSGSLGLSTQEILPIYEAVLAGVPQGASDSRRFFEEHFQPFLIRLSDDASGLVTGFYEPEVEVSATPSGVWTHPFYRRPPDIIDISDEDRPADMLSSAFGRRQDGAIRPYPDRRDIDQGYLAGRGLEIAWARDRVDVFFAHVQGAARLRFPDGSLQRITYAAKSGHAFSGIGRLLVDRGEIDAATVSMQTIRAWLARNPQRIDEVLWHNRSYIFFREAAVDDLALGPVAAAKVPLLPGRSLAVDRMIHTFGFPFYVHAPTLTHLDGGRSFARMLLALDTGSAIVGPARGDIFTGSGDAAGELAGTVRNAADFYILIPKAVAARYGG